MEHLERQHLTAWVVQQFSDYGTVWPTVFLELEAQQGQSQRTNVQQYRVSPLSGEPHARAVRLFELGREVGRQPQNRAREVLDICLISEIWITQGRNPTPGKRPPRHIPCQEGVLFLLVSATHPMLQAQWVLQIIRQKDHRIQLVPLPLKTAIDAFLVHAFLAGYRSRDLSDEEAQRLLSGL